MPGEKASYCSQPEAAQGLEVIGGSTWPPEDMRLWKKEFVQLQWGHTFRVFSMVWVWLRRPCSRAGGWLHFSKPRFKAPLGSDFHWSRLSLKSTSFQGDESPPKNSLQEERFDEKQRMSQANKELITSTKKPSNKLKKSVDSCGWGLCTATNSRITVACRHGRCVGFSLCNSRKFKKFIDFIIKELCNT